MILQYIP